MLKKESKVDSLRELKNYLLFLKDYGYQEIPLEQDPEVLNSLSFNFQGENKVQGREFMFKSKKYNLTKKLKVVFEELGDCQRCKLCEGRKNIVFGSGNPRTKARRLNEFAAPDRMRKFSG